MRYALVLLLACLMTAPAQAQIPKPSAEQMRRFTRELDQLEKTFFDTQRQGQQFGDRFWRESKRVADRNGPDIIAAIMLRGRKWRGEEGLIFSPLVDLLPRERTLAILRAYQRAGRPSDRVWAREFMIEFEAEDSQEGVRRYGK